MSEAFRGEVYQKVDAKGRVLIPAPFRRILDADDKARAEKENPHVYMVFGGKSRTFVECYSRRGADELAARVEAMQIGSNDRKRAERNLVSRSVMLELDPEGRVVLPPKVREKLAQGGPEVGPGTELVFAGVTNRFLLYTSAVYEAEEEEEDEEDDVDPLALVGRATAGMDRGLLDRGG